MSLQRKEYLCQVTIVEARELAGTDDSGTCDPFVRVTCGNAEPQATTTESETNNPSWNQSFTFSNLNLTDNELETWELKIECVDFNMFMTNVLIGSFSIGLATLNRNSNHEFYNTWITLLHTDYGSTPRGYLLINCFIVGPDDVPPAHAIGEQMGLEEDADDEEEDDDDLLTAEQKKMKKLKKKAISVVKTPLVAKKLFQLSINLYRADKLSKIEGKDPSAFASVRTCGHVEKTHYMESTCNPIWNLKISFPASTPIMNDRITIRLWDYRSRSRDKLIATLPEIPNDNDVFNISTLISRGGVLSCRWFNLYGASEEEDTVWNDIKKMTGLAKKTYGGTCYLGRMLMSMTVSPNDDPESGITKANQYREPRSQIFQLKVTMYEMKNADECGDKVRIRFSIGHFYVFSKTARKKEKEDERSGEKIVYFTWGSSYSGELLPEIKEPFPIDPSQTPDLIIDLYSEGLFGEKRIGYIRKPIEDLIGNDSPIWIPFKSIDSHSNVGQASPGLLLASIFYGVESPENKGPKMKPRKVERYLYWNVYSGIDMAPALSDEDTKLLLKIYCGDIVVPMDSKNGYKPNKDISTSSKYPIWNWAGDRVLQLHEDLHFEQNMRVEVHQQITHFKLIDGLDDIGQFSIPLHELSEEKSKQPNFYHVVNSKNEGVSQGRIIASFYISKEKLSENPCKDRVEYKNCDIQVALVGIRGLKPPYESIKLTMEIPGYENGSTEAVVMDKIRDKSNPSILQMRTFKNVTLPSKLIYLPAIYVKVEDTALLSWNSCFTYISLINYCSWIEDGLEKREALELYHKALSRDDLIQQKPKEIVVEDENKKKKAVKTEEMTDYGSELSDNESENDEILIAKNTVPLDDIFEPKNSKVMTKIQFDKSKDDEMVEEEQRKSAKESIESKLEAKKNEAKAFMQKTGKISEAIKADIKKLEKQLEVIDLGKMDEYRFLKKDEEDDEGEFQYGRPIYKEGLLDDILKPAYHRYPLFRKTKNIDKLSVHKIGEPNGAVFKVMVNIKINDSDEDPLKDPTKLKWDFNFFHPVFRGGTDLLSCFSDIKVAVRVYVLRGLSLSAVDNASDLKAMAAGMEALSSATTYPEILLGEKKLTNVKYFLDNGAVEKDNLNPEYFRTYELTGTLPSDFNLQITIWNQNSYSFDQIIGTTSIDMEDRYFGSDYISQVLMMNKAKERIDRDIDEEVDSDKRIILNGVKKAIKSELAKIKESKYVAPVEYRPLKAKGKSTAQGMIELFVEVLDSQTAKLVPVSKIAKPVPEKYELRLIVWKCEGIPLGERDAVDIFFKVQFDPSGWLSESKEKETDVHAGSEDGHGIFNWRMKFNFELPCNFARIRIVSYDFSTFGTDEMISEVVLDLARYFRRVMKEGKLTQEEQWIDLIIPGEHPKAGGKVMISFTILSQAEADNTPVGEGQDEPNRDPELEKPEEGRGIMDFLKGTALDVSKWSLFNFGLLKKLLMLLSLIGTVVVLFIYPGLVSKPN